MNKRGRRGELAWHEFVQSRWALARPVFLTIQRVLAQRAQGVLVSEEERAAAKAQREVRMQAAQARREMAASGNIYVTPVCGIITQKAGLMSEYSGGCAVEDLVEDVREAMALPSVSAVLLDFDSPGGSVYGVPEAFDVLKAMRGQKPLVALCDPIAASAAYWLACACDSVYCIPSGEAGSVGVYMSHTDYSAMNQQIGIDVTYISAGKYKTEGNPDAPLSSEGKAFLQTQVDDTYAEFIADVAEGRGVSVATVQEQYGQGRCLLAADALAAGMIDGVLTFDQVIAQLSAPTSGRKTRRGARVIAPRRATPPVQDDTDQEDYVEPGADGSCPDGYEMDDDSGVCLLAKTPKATTARQSTARLAGVVPKDVSDKLAPKDTPWEAPTLQDFGVDDWDSASEDKKRSIAGHYAWAKEMPPASFGDLKLPHHRASDGAVVYKGVTSALGALNGARGESVDIPEADKGKVRAHLEAHEKAFEKADDASATDALRDRLTVQLAAMDAAMRAR